MSQPSIFGDAFIEELRRIIREEVLAATGTSDARELLTPDELAQRLKVPVSWVYEQSRQGAIPSCKLGKYIRFNLTEVLASAVGRKTSH